MNQQRSFELIDRVLKLCDSEVHISINDNTLNSTRLADNIVTQNIHKHDCTLNLQCAYGQQHASASTNNLSDEGLLNLVKHTQEAAKISPIDSEYMPVITPDEVGENPNTNAWSDHTAAVEPEAIASRIEKAIQPAKQDNYRISGACFTRSDLQAIGTSSGVKVFQRSNIASTHMTALGKDGNGWDTRYDTDIQNIDLSSVVNNALMIAKSAQNPIDIEPGKYTVILRPAAVQEMIPYYLIADAKETDEGRTCLSHKINTQIASPLINLTSDPSNSACPSPSFEWDGRAYSPIDWVKDGSLKNLSTSRYWAKQKGIEASRGPSNIIMGGSDKSVEQLVSETEKGILVTRFWYIRVVDPMTSLLTGMTRDGLFLIENGKIKAPIRQMRFNESVLNAVKNVEAIGQQQRIGNCLIPALQIKDFNFSSKTGF